MSQLRVLQARAMERLQLFWQARDSRERQLLLIAGVLVAVLCLSLPLRSLTAANTNEQERLDSRLEQLAWMQGAIEAAPKRAAAPTNPSQMITSAARRLSAQVTRLEPLSGGRYSAWFADISYAQALQIIDAVNTGDLSVDSVAITALPQPGRVSLRLATLAN